MNLTSRSSYKKPILSEQYNLQLKNDNADRADDIDTYPHTALRYGAVGDGVTDDTAALQATIDAAKDFSIPGVAYFPEGKYRISSPLTIDRRVRLLGCGGGSQIFQENDEHLFSISPYIAAACQGMVIEGLSLGSAATTPGKALIRMDSVSDIIVNEVMMAGGSYGISMTNSHTGRFNNLKAYPNGNGFFATCANPTRWVSADEIDCNAHVFISPLLEMGGYGFYMTEAEVLTIVGGCLQGGSSTGMYLSGINRLSVFNTHFESLATQLYLNGCVNGSLFQIGLGGGAVILKGCTGITIEESKFSGSAFTISPGCKRCVINGIRYGATTLRIAPGTTDVHGLENSADANVVYAGENYSSTRNLIDGDMESWTSSAIPDGFTEFNPPQVNSRETTIVKHGSSSAKVVIGAGDNRAGLRIALDYDKYSRMHAVTYRSPNWSWVLSASGTNEYRLATAGGADPDLPCKPKGVLVSNTWASEGTMGALADGKWDYGDNDGLGYNTIYVRNNAGDPDAEAVGWLQAVFTLARLTISGWVYKESGSANPYLGMEFTGGIAGTYRKYLSFGKVPLNQWTRISLTVDILTGSTAMKAMFCNCWYGQGSPGDTCYWDALEVAEGDASSPVYDDSRGIDNDFRVGGRFLLGPIQAFTDGDATPSVADGSSFKTANTGPTTITDFNDGYIGQQITVYIEDANTTVDFSASGLIGNGGVDWSPASGDHMVCSYDGTDWRCLISDADMVKRDGSTTLTSTWDIGAGQRIDAEEIRARSNAGLKLFEDGGAGIFIEDGGDVGIGTENPAKRLSVSEVTAQTSVCVTGMDVGMQSTGTPGIGFGSNLGFKAETSTPGTTEELAAIGGVWEDPTAGSVDGALVFLTRANSGAYVEGMRVHANGNVRVGDSTNKAVIDPTGGGITYHGTARPTRYIELPIEIFEPEGDGGSNTGTVTGNFDTTNFREYWRWTSGSASQDMDFWVEFMIPDDFSAWAVANSFNIDIRTNDKDNNVATVTMYLNDDSVDAGINGVSILPSANDTWETKQDQPTGSYSAGQRAKLKVHVGNNAGSDTVDIARVFLTYVASN